MTFDYLDSFSVAELTALRLDLEVYELLGTFLPIDTQNSVALKAQLISKLLPKNSFAERQTVLWLFGYSSRLGKKIQIAQDISLRRTSVKNPIFDCREIIIDSARELISHSGLKMPNKYRLLIECLRNSKNVDELAITRLAKELDLSEVLAYLERLPKHPRNAEVKQKLAALYSIDVVNSINSAHSV